MKLVHPDSEHLDNGDRRKIVTIGEEDAISFPANDGRGSEITGPSQKLT